MDLFKIMGTIAVDNAAANKNIEQTTKKASGLSSNLGKGIKTVAKWGAAITAVGVAAGTAAATGMIKMAKATSEYGDEIDKNSQRMGMSVEAYQKWDYALKISGSSIQNVQMGMKTLTNKLEEARKGSKSAVKSFEEIGLTMDDLKGKSREDAFMATVKSLQNVEDGTKKAAMAQKLFGRSGQEMLPLLNSSNEDLDKLMKTAEDYGMVMSEKTVKASAAFQDSLTTMQQTATGLKNRLSGELLPSLTEVTDGLGLIFKGDYDQGMDKINSGIENLTTKISDMLPKVIEVGGKIVISLAEGIIKNIPKLFTSAVDLIGKLGTYILNALPKLLEILPKIFNAIISSVTQALPLLLNSLLTTITTLLPKLVTDLTNMVNTLIPTLIQIAVQAIVALAKALPEIMKSKLDLQKGLLEAVINGVQAVIEVLPTIITSIVDALLECLPMMIEAYVELFVALVEALPQIIEAITDAIPLIIDGILEALVKSTPALVDAGFKLFCALVKNTPKILSVVMKTPRKIIESILKALIEGLPNIAKTGQELLVGIVKNLPQAWSSIKSGIKTMLDNMKDLLMSIPVYEIGVNIVKGLWNGIKSVESWIKEKLSSFCDNITKHIKKFFGIHSPSTVMRDQVGKYLSLGVADGVEAEEDAVTNQIGNSMSKWLGATDNLKKSLSSDMAINAANTLSVESKNNGSADVKKAIDEFKDSMYDIMVQALSDGVRLNWDNREVGRVVKKYVG